MYTFDTKLCMRGVESTLLINPTPLIKSVYPVHSDFFFKFNFDGYWINLGRILRFLSLHSFISLKPDMLLYERFATMLK